MKENPILVSCKIHKSSIISRCWCNRGEGCYACHLKTFHTVES